MAFTGESAGLTWQRVRVVLDGSAGGTIQGASPGARMAFEAFRKYLAQDKGNPIMQFVQFDSVTNGSDGGNAATVVGSGDCTLRAIYARKTGAGTVDAWFKVNNSATVLSGTGDQLSINGKVQGTEFFQFYGGPGAASTLLSAGLPFATGITVGTVTAGNGTTQSLKADSFNGFVLITA